MRLPVSEQGGWRLKDGIEAPARDAVDEETDEETLVEETGSGLDACAGEEQERKDVMVDAEVEGRDGDADEEERGYDAVDGEVVGEAAFEAEEPDLAERDEEDGDDDYAEREDGSGLRKVAGCEAGYGEFVKGVVV